MTLKWKIKDNNLYCVKLRKRRNWLRGTLESTLGSRSARCRTIVEQVKTHVTKLRSNLKTKHRKKIEHLVRKYGKKGVTLDEGVVKQMGSPGILLSEELVAEDVRDPVTVTRKGEQIVLSEEEKQVLRLGPKFSMYCNLSEEEFETDLEESIMKVKWDMMAEEKTTKPGLEDIALRVLLGSEVCDEIDSEKQEEQDILEAETRNIFDQKTKTFNFSKRRATDLKGNSRVYFPRKPRSLEEESKFETLRVELRGTFKNYVNENCKEGGKQSSNLTPAQWGGMKSLRKRVSEGELVIIPTDKSGRLAVMTRDTYTMAGLHHTRMDKEVGWDEIKESQKEINGHVSMMIKTFRIGNNWDHGQRVRETTMGEGLSICPMSLLFKDHKGWSADTGTVPPTRPVVGGHLGLNMHLSELVSDILDPVVSNYDGGKEIISTEDGIARIEILNNQNEGWHDRSYWGDMETDEYKACTVCRGDEGYTWDDMSPEVCSCEDLDGISEDGKMMITMGAMRKLRRHGWEQEVKWDEDDLDRMFLGQDVLHEDLQDQTSPMTLVGTDVANLYPSLDISQVVDQVEQAILDSSITWQSVDYLEAARYIALNWTEDKCRQSGLWRVLPKRRGTRGTRPGLKGAGPQGGERGDQEQWVFPRVRLRPKEKKLLVATVVKLATEAMFKHHYYGFAGKKFQQREGGPIGLRGTCSIARLVMQMFDKQWEALVGNAGLKLSLYMRYMDDGRIFLHQIQRGWKWRMGQLVFCRRWQLEDASKNLQEITMEVLRESMRGVVNYLSFTYETGSEYSDGWLPTLDTNLVVTPENQVYYKYYEKPTTANTTLLKSSAMAENQKMQCLSNDLVRRLLNTREGLPTHYRADVVNCYGVKLLTSGYSYDQVRKILMNGAKGYLAKVRRRKANGERLHRTAWESNGARMKKKLLGKSTWFRDKGKKELENTTHSMKGGSKNNANQGAENKTLRTRTVLFVDQTPMGALAARLREQLARLGATLGFKIRVVERTGRNILTNFSQLHTWRGIQCGRDECITCNQGGEELPSCTKSSVVYESICLKCNPGAKGKGELKNVAEGAPSLYVGETSRTIQERAAEHWGAAKRRKENSHIAKHQAMEHVEEEPEFIFKIVSYHRSSLNRQVREAVRIRRRGGAGQILNSKAEYNRCHIPRLVVEKEDEDSRRIREERERKEDEDLERILKDMDLTWEERKEIEKDQAERKRRRPKEIEDEQSQEDGKQRNKRMKYTRLEEDWGVGGGEIFSEDEDGSMEQEVGAVTIVPTPAPHRPSSKNTITSVITDYFPALRTAGNNKTADQTPEPTLCNDQEALERDQEILVEDDFLNGEEDDVWGTQEDQDDILIITQMMMDQYDPPNKSDRECEASPTIAPSPCQEDRGRGEDPPELYSSSTTTPRRVGFGGDLTRSTAMYHHWDEINETKKDQAFELWTSPTAPRVPDIVRVLGGVYDVRNDHSDKITKTGCQEDQANVKDEELTPEPSSVSARMVEDDIYTAPTEKPFPTMTTSVMDDRMTQPPSHTAADITSTTTTTKDGLKRKTSMPGVSRIKDEVTQGGQPGGSGGSPRLKTTCMYDERGVCDEHGQGIQKFRPSHVMTVGKDGKPKKKYVRQPYFVCDVGLGGKKLKQTQLHFFKLTAGRVDMGGRADDNSNGVGGPEFCTSKEGQTGSCGRVAGSRDEKGFVQ